LKDRTPKYPGRVQLTPVEGAENTFDLVRADEPVEEGTPLNKKTLLTDETAYLLELKVDNPTPDDAFSHIARNFTGDGGMNINLLEEAIHMKYCKVLTHEGQRSAVADFYASSIVQTGYESDDGMIQVLACIEKSVSTQLKVRIINKNTGKVFNSVIPLYADVYKYELNDSSVPGSGMYANFNGWFHVTPVKNKPNEVMLKICGDLFRSTYDSEYLYYSNVMRMVHILDVTTGEAKAHAYAYYANSSGSYKMASIFNLGIGSNDYCYYNATYGYYYTPLTYQLDSSFYNSARPFYIKPGCNYEVSTYDTFSSSGVCGFISAPTNSNYIGNTYHYSSEYPGRCFAWYVPITDTTGISFSYDSYVNYMYVYSVSQTAYATFSKTTLYSSTSFYGFANQTWCYYPSNDYGLKVHVLLTDDNKLYMFAAGQRHTSHTGYSTNEYYCLMRFGPFSLNTSSSNPPVATVIKGVPSSGTSGYTSYKIFNIIGCENGDPDKPIYCILPYSSAVLGGYGGIVTSLATGVDGKAYRLMMPSVMAGSAYTSSTQIYYRYDGINNPWAQSLTLPTCWYNQKLTKMFMCEMDRTVYLGDFVDQIYTDTDGVWTCPEDGTYKIIMVGGGAAGGASYGGGSGYLKIVTRFCTAGEEIPYHIGWGGIYDNGTSNPYAAQPGSPTTWFETPDTFANGGAGSRGGANGYPSSVGGGGGGYDLVEYGGNGQTSSVAPQRNGGQGTMAAIGYGAGGCAQSDGSDGVIVIVR